MDVGIRELQDDSQKSKCVSCVIKCEVVQTTVPCNEDFVCGNGTHRLRNP